MFQVTKPLAQGLAPQVPELPLSSTAVDTTATAPALALNNVKMSKLAKPAIGEKLCMRLWTRSGFI